MAGPVLQYDWRELADEQLADQPIATRHRLRWILAAFAIALVVILGRAMQLEFSDGANHRRLAAKPLERTVTLPAARGRILARDGSVLAADQEARALAMHYRYLETPSNPRWLRRQARARLSASARRDPKQVSAAESAVRGEIEALHRRLVTLCGIKASEWQARTNRIQDRVAALADDVNRRRLSRYLERSATEVEEPPAGGLAIVAGLFSPPDELPPPEVDVAEEAAFHRLVDDLPAAVVEAIADEPDRFPGVRIVTYKRRAYPQQTLAANLIGHVSGATGAQATVIATRPQDSPAAPVGLMATELLYEQQLQGRPGSERQWTNRRGEVISVQERTEPVAGGDVVLTIDPQVQHFAEQLLDRFARRPERASAGVRERSGGAIVVLDVHSGEILAAASEPRFDPNLFAAGDPQVEALLHDGRQPLFDRALKMAIAPGSVFKPLTALALLSRDVVTGEEKFFCQGYLEEPDRLRCQLFRQQGIGHGDTNLSDALMQSCNVYFFHHVTSLGGAPLLDWSGRFGFGQPIAQIGADSISGQLPELSDLRQSGRLQNFSVGQGAFTATPLQVARMYAALANGGYLITPSLTRESVAPKNVQSTTPHTGEKLDEDLRVPELKPDQLKLVQAALQRVVNDPRGTAYDTVRLPKLVIAGKTGTAETGGEQPDHAWFAGYAPADAPRLAFVVVLEHGGSGSTAAGTMARSLVTRLSQLGYVGAPAESEPEFPPGKG